MNNPAVLSGIYRRVGTCCEVKGQSHKSLTYLRGGPSSSDCSHSSLHRGCPRRNINVVRLVHDSKDDIRATLILGSDLSPQVCELSVRRASLPNDCTVPSSIIMLLNSLASRLFQAASIRTRNVLPGWDDIDFKPSGKKETGFTLRKTYHVDNTGRTCCETSLDKLIVLGKVCCV